MVGHVYFDVTCFLFPFLLVKHLLFYTVYKIPIHIHIKIGNCVYKMCLCSGLVSLSIRFCILNSESIKITGIQFSVSTCLNCLLINSKCIAYI